MFPLASGVVKGNREAASKKLTLKNVWVLTMLNLLCLRLCSHDMDSLAGVTLVIKSVLPVSSPRPPAVCIPRLDPTPLPSQRRSS